MDLKDRKYKCSKNYVEFFYYVFIGLKIVFLEECNMRFYIFVVFVVVICGFFFYVIKFEWILLIFFIFGVLMLEMVNIVIE